MSAKQRWTYVMGLAVLFIAPHVASAFDPLRTSTDVPQTAAGVMVPDTAGCLFTSVGNPLTLAEAVQRTLCNNPKTREAWADIQVQAAGLGVARSAYLPTLSGNSQVIRDDAITNVLGHPSLSSDTLATINSEGVELNWTLYDFGAREAAVRNARALLAAARSTHDATLQSVFVSVAKDYYAAQAASDSLTTAIEVEQTASNSARATQARVDKGIAPISDALQAKTAYLQTVVNRHKAESTWQSAIGTLATDMALSPETRLPLPMAADGIQPDEASSQSIADLIDEAKRAHPTVLAAQAKVDAATAKVDQVSDQGLPSISLISKYSRDNQPASLGLGIPEFPAIGHQWYIGVQISIPFFEGFNRTYQIRQVRAQLAEQEDELDDARQQVALEVWNSYAAVKAATNEVHDSTELLNTAQHSFDAAEHRYQAGVGNVLELLTSQAALANAKQQKIQSFTDWQAARLRLAGSLGQLDMTDIH